MTALAAILARMPRRGAPAPNRQLLLAMSDAAKAGDTTRFNILHSQYLAEAADQGWVDHAHGCEAPKEAFE